MSELYKEKLFDPPGQMDLVHALTILHAQRDLCRELYIDDVAEALTVVFCWIDDMALLVNRMASGRTDQEGGFDHEMEMD